jgi:hypothetical protein
MVQFHFMHKLCSGRMKSNFMFGNVDVVYLVSHRLVLALRITCVVIDLREKVGSNGVLC